MAARRTYKPSWGPRLVNRVFRRKALKGGGKDSLHVLGVPGRRSGELREIPLHVIILGGARYVVAIYGVHEWVRNLRANRMQAVLMRAGKSETVRVVEVDEDEAGEVLREYARLIPHVRPYLDVRDESVRSWQVLAATHPVFRVVDDSAPRTVIANGTAAAVG